MTAINPHAPAKAPEHEEHVHEGVHHDHPPHLAHHFDTPEQQFDSAKVGMWVFLATEILMFGGLFCAYAVYRYNHPEVFHVAESYLNTTLGAINTAVLLASSLTMALAVRAAQLGQTKSLIAMLSATLLGGVGFMCIKSVEYTEKLTHGYGPGSYSVFSQDYVGEVPEETHRETHEAIAQGIEERNFQPAESQDVPADPTAVAGADNVNEGGSTDDGTTVAAPKPDIAEADNANPTNQEMAPDAAEPPSDRDQAIAALPSEQALQQAENAGQATEPLAVDPEVVERQREQRLATLGPAYVDPLRGTNDEAQIRPNHAALEGLRSRVVEPHSGAHYIEPTPDQRTYLKSFFSIYYLMTGLHGLHVLIGMGLITWVLIKSTKGIFGPAYYTPVDLVGLYWHLVDLIWIFLFPLLYLIH